MNKDKEMFATMAKILHERHFDQTLYGKKTITVNKKGKEEISFHYKPCGHCFEYDESYKMGEFKGLSFSVVYHDGRSFNKAKSIKIHRVSEVNGVPFEPIRNTDVFLPIDDFHKFIEDTNGNMQELSALLCKFAEENKNEINKEGYEGTLFNLPHDYDGQNIFFYYEGTGDNQIRVEVESTNLSEYMPSHKLMGGIQLSLF